VTPRRGESPESFKARKRVYDDSIAERRNTLRSIRRLRAAQTQKQELIAGLRALLGEVIPHG